MYHRRSIRLRHYDYSQQGVYFLTFCTRDKEPLFGEIAYGRIVLKKWGKIAENFWYEIPDHFENVLLDEFIVMPNHVHGILVILESAQGAIVGAQHAAPLQDTSESRRINVKPGSLGAIVRSYKSAVSRYINQQRQTPGAPVWQRNYYDHIIQNIDELHATRLYIRNNPANWREDEYHPVKK